MFTTAPYLPLSSARAIQFVPSQPIFLKVCRIIILTSTPRFSKCPLSFIFPHETPVRTLLFPLRPPSRVFDMHPTHFILLTVHIWVPVLDTIICRGKQCVTPWGIPFAHLFVLRPQTKLTDMYIYIYASTDEMHSWLPCWRYVLCWIRTSHPTNHCLP